ncbi:MAG: ParM/StbA family protein, partial [Desulfosporosinus sp.]|nr:ParM/StbA family protein [Desulfosporosinus sp.]
WDENKSSDEDSMALLIAQLATGQTAKAEGRDSKVTFYVGTGLPIKHYFQHKQAYEQNIKGDFTVIFRSGPWEGVKCTLKIIRCQVYPQVWGIFWNETHDQLGNLINEQYRHGYTLVVDPGFGTTDYALFIDGVMKDAYCDSSELGIASAMKQVSENLAEKGVNLDEKELDHYFMEQDGVYIFNGEAIDLKTIREVALKSLGKKLYDDLKIKLQPVWDKIQVSLVGGGGGKALFNYLNLDNKQLVADPQFGNASGFRKAAQGALLKSVHSHG